MCYNVLKMLLFSRVRTCIRLCDCVSISSLALVCRNQIFFNLLLSTELHREGRLRNCVPNRTCNLTELLTCRWIAAGNLKRMCIVWICGRGEWYNDISYPYFTVERSRCSYSYQVFAAILSYEFPGIYAHGRHSHAATLYRHRNVFVDAGKAKHTSYIIILFYIPEVVLGNEFCPQGVSRKQYGLNR